MSAYRTYFKWICCLSLCFAELSVISQTQEPPEHPWMQLSNQLSLSVEHYSATGIDGRQLPMTYILQGSPTVQIGDTPVPFSFVLSSFQNSYQTPFNQIGSSPKYKWIQVHLGYRNLQYSNFTLGGQRMLGAGVELTPGKWQFGFFWGVIRRAIAPDSTLNNQAPPGALSFGPGYRRAGWGAKVGYGKKEKSHVVLSMFRGRDHESSIDPEFRSLVRKPEMNTVFGILWNIRLSKKFSWLTDAAISAYTRNTTSDSISLEGVPAANFIGDVFMPRISSQYLSAFETGLYYKSKKFKASVKYRRIDPDFKSMGIYFINSDLEEISLNPSLRLNQKWNLNGSVGLQRDNLNDFKQRTTERVIYRAGVDWSPVNWFALGLQHSNFGLSQSALAPNIADTTLIRQVNTMYAAQPRFTFKRESVIHVIQLNGSRQQLSNAFDGAFAPPDVTTSQLTTVYSFNLIERGLSISPSVSWINVQSDLFRTTSAGAALGLGLPLRFVPVRLNAQAAYFSNQVDGSRSGGTSTGSLQLSYALKNGMAFSAGAQYLNNEGSDSESLPAFTELRLRAGFTWSFSKSVTKSKQS